MKRTTIEMLRSLTEDDQGPQRPVLDELRQLTEGFVDRRGEVVSLADEIKRVHDALVEGLKEIPDEDPDKKPVGQILKSLAAPIQQVLKEAKKADADPAALKVLADAALAVCRPIPESLKGKVQDEVVEVIQAGLEELMKPLVALSKASGATDEDVLAYRFGQEMSGR
jgi:hypothetical protein